MICLIWSRKWGLLLGGMHLFLRPNSINSCLHKLTVIKWLNWFGNPIAYRSFKCFCGCYFMITSTTRTSWLGKFGTWRDGPKCLLCEEGVNETRDCLFFECKFARSCWGYIHMNWDSTKPIAANQSCQKNSFQPTLYIVEIFACASWNIWKARNGHIFQDQQPDRKSVV